MVQQPTLTRPTTPEGGLTPHAHPTWRLEEVRAIYDTPLLELVFRAAQVHRAHHDPREVQVCKLISIKTGGCPEDCKYCSQSSRYQTDVKAQPLMDKAEVLEIARRAKEAGVTRVCMGAARARSATTPSSTACSIW